MGSSAVEANVDSVVYRDPLRALLVALEAIVVRDVSHVHIFLRGRPD